MDSAFGAGNDLVFLKKKDFMYFANFTLPCKDMENIMGNSHHL